MLQYHGRTIYTDRYLIKIQPGEYDLGGSVDVMGVVHIEGAGAQHTILNGGHVSYWGLDVSNVTINAGDGRVLTVGNDSITTIKDSVMISNHNYYGVVLGNNANINNVEIINTGGGYALFFESIHSGSVNIFNTKITGAVPVFSLGGMPINFESCKFTSTSNGYNGILSYSSTINVNNSIFELTGSNGTAFAMLDSASANITNSKIILKDSNGNLDPNAIVANSPRVKIANSLISGGQKNTYKSVFNYDENYSPLANQ